MDVKCYLAKGPELDLSMMELLSKTRNDGQTSMGGLANDMAGISLSRNREALCLVGGRDSIFRWLLFGGIYPPIVGTAPFLVTFARKHRVFGKNETCVKIVCGQGHRQPDDGSDFFPLGEKYVGQNLRITPPELAHLLHQMYGWG